MLPISKVFSTALTATANGSSKCSVACSSPMVTLHVATLLLSVVEISIQQGLCCHVTPLYSGEPLVGLMHGENGAVFGIFVMWMRWTCGVKVPPSQGVGGLNVSAQRGPQCLSMGGIGGQKEMWGGDVKWVGQVVIAAPFLGQILRHSCGCEGT